MRNHYIQRKIGGKAREARFCSESNGVGSDLLSFMSWKMAETHFNTEVCVKNCAQEKSERRPTLTER